MPMLRNGLQVDYSINNGTWQLVCSRIPSSRILECKYITFAISILNNLFRLHAKMKKLSSQVS